MRITILPKAKTEKAAEFTLEQPNILTWLEATEEGNRKFALVADLKSFGIDYDTLMILRHIILKHGKFDGKSWDEPAVNNLELGFFISLYGELIREDGTLQDYLEEKLIEKAQTAIEE